MPPCIDTARSRYHPVATQIRAALPRFKDLTDRQILDAPFKLVDAQELVARQAGFDTWQALRTGVQTMAGSAPSVSPPVLSAVEAQLFVADIEASCTFFTGKLGFDVVFTYGEPVFVGDIREREQLLSASLTVAGAAEFKLLFLQYQTAGVDFLQLLKQEPWGARTFIVRDPDGNLLLFAGPAG